MDKFSEAFRFRTGIGDPDRCLDLDYSSRFFTIGSCFAEQIGSSIRNLKFNISVNPFGTVYDPISIHRLLDYALDNHGPGPASYVERDGVFYCDEFHSSVHATSVESLNEKIRELIQTVHHDLRHADVLMITWGTAWSYSRKDSGKPVANCHKMPGQLFSKTLLQPSELIASFHAMYDRIRKINPEIKLMLTISPVRHVKDTLELNAVSKSVLRLAAHELSQLPGVSYYPAFEIMTDDLRDYRFYGPDLIHPNEQAVDYIWNHLKYFLFSEATRSIMERCEKIIRSLAHRPYQSQTESHQKFLQRLVQEINELNGQVDFSKEWSALQNQLNGSGA